MGVSALLMYNNLTRLTMAATGGLGELEFLHPPGTTGLTPASRVAILAIAQAGTRLVGQGLDWGSGTGCLAITAARLEGVSRVVGLELLPANVAIAHHNAVRNGVVDKVQFIVAASYAPLTQVGRDALATLRGQTDFILANPPASDGDDGLGYRRELLRGAREYLAIGGVVLLSISAQYGQARITRLQQEISGFSYGGVLASSGWVPFDLRRPDLRHCLELYTAEERRGGLPYQFRHPARPEAAMDAQAALAYFRQSGASPLTQWQTHLFRYGAA